MPAACNACEGIGTSFNAKPSRVSEPGDEGMEARDSEGCEDSHPFPRQLRGSPMVPGTPTEHRPPLQTSALGLCEGQETLHSHKITFLIISRFQYGKENAFGLCPQLCHSQVREEHGGGLHGEPTLDMSGGAEPSDTCPSRHLGKLCISQQNTAEHVTGGESTPDNSLP